MQKIKSNKIRCKKCGTIAESTSRHQMSYCQCEAVAADGGLDYLRRVWNEGVTYEELSEHEDDGVFCLSGLISLSRLDLATFTGH